MNYIEFCETIFQNWKKNPYYFQKDFGFDFQTEFLPEPYLVWTEGDTPLYVLNYNPGQAGFMVQQHSFAINGGIFEKKQFSNGFDTFSELTNCVAAFYRGDLGCDDNARILGGKALSRYKTEAKLAKKLGYQGCRCVESFPLHSKGIKARPFLNKYSGDAFFKEYTKQLTRFLKDKPVLCVSSIGFHTDITLEAIRQDSWLSFQCDVIGLDLNNAILNTSTPKGKTGLPGTAILVGKNHKIMTIVKGSNSVPKIAFEQLDQITAFWNK